MIHDLVHYVLEGYSHFTSVLRDTLVGTSGSGFGVILVVTWVFVCTGMALSMNMNFVFSSLSMFKILLLPSMTVSGSFASDNSLLYCVEVFWSSSIKATKGRFT